MKTLLITILLLITTTIVADELSWVDEQVQAIKPPRTGVSTSKINVLGSPFVFLKKGKEESTKKDSTVKKQSTPNSNSVSEHSQALVLDAIINKSALINGKWYKEQEKVGKYTLSRVDRKIVVLKYEAKELFLSVEAKSKNIKFKNN